METARDVIVDCARRIRTVPRHCGVPFDCESNGPAGTSVAKPLTLGDGFKGSSSVTATTFAVDPDFRVGTAQNWTLSIQQDLPAAMQFSLSYLGVKGTHVPQRILPNTYPYGASSVCAGCPTGFAYLMSGGSSNRHAGTVEIRRRQRNGFQASVQYTFAKAIDDAGLGGNAIAQNFKLRLPGGLQ